MIERVRTDKTKSSRKESFQEEHVEVPLSREEVLVEKRTHVTGGARVRKTEGTEQETVHDSVRREDVDVDESAKTRHKGNKPTDAGA